MSLKTSIYQHNSRFNKEFMNYIDSSDISVFYDIDSFKATHSDIRIAIIELDYFNYPESRKKIFNLLKEDIHKLVIVSVELDTDVYNLIQDYVDKKNVIFFINGVVHNIKNTNALFVCDLHHIHKTSSIYTLNITSVIKKLNPFSVKKYYFDVMYGLKKDNRVFVHKSINKNIQKDKFFQTDFFHNIDSTISGIIDSTTSRVITEDNKNFWEPEIKKIEGSRYVEYYGAKMMPSQVLPISIYNQTLATIVMESKFDNKYSFFTEKIVKPMLSFRMFIVFSNQYYLRDLKLFGFKTFDTIIDESYDDIEDNELRWAMAFKEVEKICNMNQKDILLQILPIVNHNFDVLKNLRFGGIEQYVEQAIIEESINITNQSN